MRHAPALLLFALAASLSVQADGTEWCAARARAVDGRAGSQAHHGSAEDFRISRQARLRRAPTRITRRSPTRTRIFPIR